MSKIVWLASYPKSGNTWLRALLSAYLTPEQTEPPDLNALVGRAIAEYREVFDETIGLPSAELDDAQIDRLRPRFHDLLACGQTRPFFIKTHQVFQYSATGQAYFSRSATFGVLYIVRNPLDVAVSYARFVRKPIDEIIEHMSDRNAVLTRQEDRALPAMAHRISSWSGHVSAWLDQTEVPVLLLQYEALHADPVKAFTQALDFCDLKIDHENRVKTALARCRFDHLRGLERRTGFGMSPDDATQFFRKGQIGDWRHTLDRSQIDAIITHHAPMMTRLGYL